MGIFHVHCEAQWQIGREWCFFIFFPPHDTEDSKIIFNVVDYESTGYFTVTFFFHLWAYNWFVAQTSVFALGVVGSSDVPAAVRSQQWLRETLLKSEHSLQRALTSTQEKASWFCRFKQFNYKQVPFDPLTWLRVGVQRNEPALNQVEKDRSLIRSTLTRLKVYY